jgi:GNAT superfamily N-acetyltransferase
MKVRAPNLADIPALAALHRHCWRAAYREICDRAWLDSLTDKDFESYHRPNIPADPRSPFLLAVDDRDDRAIIGFARGGKTRDKSPVGDPLPIELLRPYSSELYALYVHPDHQKKGVGVAMFDGIKTALRARGHRAMMLWVMTQNQKAQKFYDARGGKPIGAAQLTFSGAKYDMTAYAWDSLRV